MFDDVIKFIRSIYGLEGLVPLHAPTFIGNEKQYLNECIESTFVSSVGNFVDIFESKIAKYTGSKYVIATSNGTSSLHIALLLGNVKNNDEVITQPLTFVATCNAIDYCGAKPLFIDVDKDTMGLSPNKLADFLDKNTIIKNKQCINKKTGRIIKACVPVHTFGHPCKIEIIKKICNQYGIYLVEDAAESLGSFYKDKHTGTFGNMGIISFNGNKVITGGGGGCILTNDESLANKAKHLTTTAKVKHDWEYRHDMVGYNYRMPNLNAALLVSQLENLDDLLKSKRENAIAYKNFFENKSFDFFEEPPNCNSNYWLNTIFLENQKQRDLFLNETNSQGISTRPIWTLMSNLSMFKDCQTEELLNSKWLENCAVNIPSSSTIR